MAKGFGNASATVTFTTAYAGLTAADVRQVTGIGSWTAAVGDITPLSVGNGNYRTKVVSGRWDPQPITMEILFDPESTLGTHPTSGTTSQILTVEYPNGASYSETAGMTAFRYGDLLDDDVMVSECEFMVVGGGAPDDVYTP